jgi:hypothetical protein
MPNDPFPLAALVAFTTPDEDGAARSVQIALLERGRFR